MPERRVRACLITNPRGGRGALALTPAQPVLRDAGWAVTVRQKTAGGAAMDLARAVARDGCAVVVDCAGHGTLNEVAAGLVGTDVAVGALPGGTVNLWAAEFGVDKRLRVAATQLVAGLGPDGVVMARVAKPLMRRLGSIAVGLAALRTLPMFTAVPVRAAHDERPWEGRVAQTIVGNTRRYGGITRITPGTLVDGGQCDVCLVAAGGVIDAGRQVGALLFEQHPSATAETYRVSQFVVEAPGPIPLQLDGSAAHQREGAPGPEGTTYTFSLIAGGPSVPVPNTYDGELFRHGEIGRREAGRRAGGMGRWLRVIASVPTAITAARVRDGRVFGIVRGRKVVARDATGPGDAGGRPSGAWRRAICCASRGCARGRGRLGARPIRVHLPPDRA